MEMLLGGLVMCIALDLGCKLVAIMLQKALYRPGGGIAKGADGAAFDAVGDVQQSVQILHRTAALC